MGHAGAIVSGAQGTAQEKMETLRKNNVLVVKNLSEIGRSFKQLL
jgi:succinyl-CoA synthetase alpha subunit